MARGAAVPGQPPGLWDHGTRQQGQIAHLDWLRQTQWSAFREIAAPNATRKNLRFRIIRTPWSDGRDGYAEVFPITAPSVNEPQNVVRELTIHSSKSIDNVLAEAFNLTQAENGDLPPAFHACRHKQGRRPAWRQSAHRA